jgi:hypothetical protein
MTEQGELPWNFEAFRRFLTYESLRNAASVIVLYDGTEVSNQKRLSEFQNTLDSRTGIHWEPERQNSEDVLFSTEGSVFRNKARVLTSMFLISPFKLKNGNIVASPVAKQLASGKMSQEEFHDFIITHYQYPHPAYEENWTAWTASGRKLLPLVYILQILYALYNKDPRAAYITTNEFARFAHANPDSNNVENIADEIIKYRSSPNDYPPRKRSDKVDRKINDIFGFLCMTKYVYYNGQNIVLNMVRLHPSENVFFYSNRTGAQSAADEVKAVIEKGLQ